LLSWVRIRGRDGLTVIGAVAEQLAKESLDPPPASGEPKLVAV
jgi:hypothetical protein